MTRITIISLLVVLGAASALAAPQDLTNAQVAAGAKDCYAHRRIHAPRPQPIPAGESPNFADGWVHCDALTKEHEGRVNSDAARAQSGRELLDKLRR